MSAFVHLPLGHRIPGSPHSVSCSLPTVHDVIGYETKDAGVMRELASGYPRFITHTFNRRLTELLTKKAGLHGQTLWLASSARMADELTQHLGSSARVLPIDGVTGVSHPENPELAMRAKLFLQHVGGFLSSREAEDSLVRLGVLPAAAPETLFAGDATSEIKRHLRRAFPGAQEADLWLTNSGMNAVYAAFRAISEAQAARGRTLWIQLGWLYLDTIAILKTFTATPDDYICLLDVFDHAAIERVFAEHGSRVAGVLTEVPTNPLVQTPDVPWLAALARRHGAALVLDPSVTSAFDVDLLPHADLVTTSLTKYTANEGDVLAGLIAVNPASPHAAVLREKLPAWREPAYARDLARLAAQIGQTETVLARIHESVPRVVAFLEKHPAVREVFWAHRAESSKNFARVARGPGTVGAMISFTLRGSFENFYDRVRLPKGPSFGMTTTILTPQVYLTHYDLMTSEAGRAELAAGGLDPGLLRLSVGAEPAEDIIAALAEALE